MEDSQEKPIAYTRIKEAPDDNLTYKDMNF
jgi:hypothetical protein